MTAEAAAQVRMMNVVIDCADVARLAAFWSAVTGFQPREGEPPWDDPAQIQALGATFLWRSSNPDDPFVTLADPEGNEFCVVRSAPAG
jgi:hypothetical protein